MKYLAVEMDDKLDFKQHYGQEITKNVVLLGRLTKIYKNINSPLLDYFLHQRNKGFSKIKKCVKTA
jgi:hypothetical protein